VLREKNIDLSSVKYGTFIENVCSSIENGVKEVADVNFKIKNIASLK